MDRAGDAEGVAHVGQTVKHGDQVVRVGCQFPRIRDLEAGSTPQDELDGAGKERGGSLR